MVDWEVFAAAFTNYTIGWIVGFGVGMWFCKAREREKERLHQHLESKGIDA